MESRRFITIFFKILLMQFPWFSWESHTLHYLYNFSLGNRDSCPETDTRQFSIRIQSCKLFRAFMGNIFKTNVYKILSPLDLKTIFHFPGTRKNLIYFTQQHSRSQSLNNCTHAPGNDGVIQLGICYTLTEHFLTLLLVCNDVIKILIIFTLFLHHSLMATDMNWLSRNLIG